MDEWQFAFQEDLFTWAVIDDDVGVSASHHLVVSGFIVPHPQLNHLHSLFRHRGFVLVAASKVEVDVAVHGWVGRRQDDALYPVSYFCALMLCGAHTFDNCISLRVCVQAGVQLRPGDVVALNNSFLPIGVRGIFPQHAHASRLHHVRVNAVVDDEFDKGRGVAQRPRDCLREHLVSIAVEPLIIECAGQRRNLAVFQFIDRRTQVDGKAGCLR